jgi:two-component system, NarL family, sensor histidine kinase UhpB
MSLTLRLNLAIFILMSVVFVLIFFNILGKTADDVRQEVINNFELSNRIVDDKIKLMHATPIEIIRPYPFVEAAAKQELNLFKLEQFNDIKYINIELLDTNNRLIASNHDSANSSTLHIPDKIEKLLLMGFFKPVESVSRPIESGTVPLGKIVVSTDSDSELRDLWYKSLSTLTPVMILFMLISFGLSFIISIFIKPISDFLRAVNKGNEQDHSHRSGLFRMTHLLRLPTHLQGIHHDLQSSSRKVQDLNNKILHLQEEERRKLSAELHDELGQHLTAIRFEAELIKTAKNLQETQFSAEAIDKIGRDMKDIVRSMLERLRPPDFELFGLRGAITEMISSWQLRHPQANVVFQFKADLTGVDDEKQLSMYRIVQEGLTNISRHAGSSNLDVSILLFSSDERISITVSDNGQGCDLAKQVKGFGLKGMRERVDNLLGNMVLDSSPGNGMKIIVEIPHKGKSKK